MDETLIEKYHRKFKVMAKMIHKLQADNLKLRYERLMNKAENLHTYGLLLTLQSEVSENFMEQQTKTIKAIRCHQIATAIEERARKLKDNL